MEGSVEDEITDEKNPMPLDEVLDPYSHIIKNAGKEIKERAKKINDLGGIKESDTALAAPSQWDLVSDKQMAQEKQPLQVARRTKIIIPNTEDAKCVTNVKQIAKDENTEKKETTLPENWTVDSIPPNNGRTKKDIDQSSKIKPAKKDVNILMTHKNISGKLDLISTPSWENVSGLDEQQKHSLGKLQTKGVLWKYPKDQNEDFVILRLSHGGDVKADGNCLFTALQKAMGGLCTIEAQELRRIAIKFFLENLGSMSER